MIGRLTADKLGYREDKDGNAYVIMRITGESRYNIKPILADIKRSGKPVTASFDFKKNKRSLDQNALLWALLTIYAEALGGGRRGSVQPEEIYYQMLNKYGVAQFLIMQEEAVLSSRGATSDVIVSATCKLFSFSTAEVGVNASTVPYVNEVDAGAETVTFPIFTDNNSRIAKHYNGTGSADYYYLRSPTPSRSDNFDTCTIGGAYGNTAAGNAYCVRCGFTL